MIVVMGMEAKCLACRKPILFGEAAHKIIYDGRDRYIHLGCTGKNHVEVKKWEKLIREQS